MTITFEWRRFWCPIDGTIDLSDAGFLANPDSDFGALLYPDLKTLPELASYRALALLGEPGVGKTTVVNAAYTAAASSPAQRHLRFDLRSYGAEDRLIREIFENPDVDAWKVDNSELTLWLDSLDECLLRIDNVATILADKLATLPAARLSIRIACRTLNWPSRLLNKAFLSLWGEDGFGSFELAPLRRKDVSHAATATGLNADAFIGAILRRGAVPLAIRPVTLNFLIKEFETAHDLPAEAAALYERGCLALADEISASRLASIKGKGELSVHQRLAIAGRVAAIMILGNKAAVWMGPQSETLGAGDVALSALTGGTERANHADFAVILAAIMETLGTGLFSSRGPDRMGWTHQTFAEFLAAWHIAQRGLSLRRVMELVVHPAGDLIPQLTEMMGWLASLRADVKTALMESYPEHVLLAAISTLAPGERALLTAKFLEGLSENRFMGPDFMRSRYYALLDHPTLAAQLRPHLTRSEDHWLAKRAAFDIAESCHVRALQPDLLALLLDESVDLRIREQAAAALRTCGDPGDLEFLGVLKRMARGDLGEDPDDQFKGYALEVLWPKYLSAEELFPLLGLPRNGSLIGAYSSFLYYDVASHMPDDGLVAGLKWAVTQSDALTEGQSSDMNRLIDGLICRGWSRLEDPEILAALAPLVAGRAKRSTTLFGHRSDTSEMRKAEHEFNTDDASRRRLLRACLIDSPEKEVFWLSHARILRPVDFDYIADTFAESPALDDVQSKRLAEALRLLFDGTNAQFERVYVLAGTIPDVHDVFDALIDGIDTESDRAKSWKKQHASLQELNELTSKRKNKRANLDPLGKIQGAMKAIESGNAPAWFTLLSWLRFDPNNPDEHHYPVFGVGDLAKIPGYRALTPELQQRILDLAVTTLSDSDPKTAEWMGAAPRSANAEAYFRTAEAVYSALALLHQEDPSREEKLPPGFWALWAGAIIVMSTSTGGDEDDVHEALCDIALKRAPEAFLSSLLARMRAEDAHYRWAITPRDGEKPERPPAVLWVLRKIPRSWGDGALQKALLSEAASGGLHPHILGDLYSHLFEHKVPGTREQAEQALTTAVAAKDNETASQLLARLLEHVPGESWPIIWKVMIAHDEIAEAAAKRIAADDHARNAIYGALPESTLGDLYEWVEARFPTAADPPLKSGRVVSVREGVGDFRTGILKTLEHRGTVASVAVLERIQAAHPELDWLFVRILAARAAMRRTTWMPVPPEHLLHILQGDPRAYIRDENDLRKVIRELLADFAADASKEPALRSMIWTPVDKTALWIPREEDALSDGVDYYFRQKLEGHRLTINREVQVTRLSTHGVGKRTDLLIQAFVPAKGLTPADDRLSVVVETKGCWNKDLMTSMESQLVDDYLPAAHASTGIYLVGWFDPAKWDPSDPRRKSAEAQSPDTLRAALEAQAQTLSLNDRQVEATVLELRFLG